MARNVKEEVRRAVRESGITTCTCHSCGKYLSNLEHAIGSQAARMMLACATREVPEEQVMLILHCCFGCHAAQMLSLGVVTEFADPTPRH